MLSQLSRAGAPGMAQLARTCLSTSRISATRMLSSSGPPAALQSGPLYTWGTGSDGQLGHANFEMTGLVTNAYIEAIPKVVDTNGVEFVHVSCGPSFTAATSADGRVYTFGKSEEGALGHGEKVLQCNQPTPIESLAGVKIVQTVCGGKHMAALSEDGEVFTWGWGGTFVTGAGALGHGDLEHQWRPKEIEFPGVDTASGRGLKVKSLASGKSHMLAIGDEGEVWSWGNGENGRLGNGGSENQLQPLPVEVLLDLDIDIKQVACGKSFSMALTSDGKLYGWGQNQTGQLGVGGSFSMDVYAMEEYPVPINTDAVTREGETIAYVATGEGHTCAVTSEGRTLVWGQSTWMEPYNLTALDEQNIVSVACGGGFSAAVNDGGEVFTWGKGIGLKGSGALGHEDLATHLQPEKLITFTSPISHVACGHRHAAAIGGLPALRPQPVHLV